MLDVYKNSDCWRWIIIPDNVEIGTNPPAGMNTLCALTSSSDDQNRRYSSEEVYTQDRIQTEGFFCHHLHRTRRLLGETQSFLRETTGRTLSEKNIPTVRNGGHRKNPDLPEIH
jgi:hypothetical protein